MTPEFVDWRESLDVLQAGRLKGRLERLAYGHFGDSRSLGAGLFELRWRSGMRVYFTRRRIGDIDTFVLHGGFKGTQNADIEKARDIQTRYERGLRDGSSDA